MPYDLDKNIGSYYNDFMDLLPSTEDFACFVDGDAVFTHNYWGKQLWEITQENKDCGLFVAKANRIGCLWQREAQSNWESDDMVFHRSIGDRLYNSPDALSVTDKTNVPELEVLGGFLILIKKATWLNLGGFKEAGMLGIDNDIHWKAQQKGEKVYLMNGVYLYHWYRGGKANNKDHLIK